MAHQLIDFEAACNEVYEKLLNSGISKADQSPFVILSEVFADGTRRSLPVTEELVKTYIEKDFGDTTKGLTTSHSRYDAIKLIHSIRRYESNVERLAHVPYPDHLFKRIAQYIRMPTMFPHVLATGTATYVDSMPSTPPTSPHDATQISQENFSFILHFVPGGTGRSSFGTCFNYDFRNRCMYIFLHTYELSSYRLVPEALDISRFGADRLSPLLIPSAMVMTNLGGHTRHFDEKKEEIFRLECELGVRVDRQSDVDMCTLDYSVLSRKINGLNASLAWLMYCCKQTERLLDFMDTVARRYKHQAIANSVDQDEVEKVEQALLNSHAYLRSWNQGLSDRREYLTSRLQALSQSVYSGIAQRDSASSISIGVTSAKLAETSQQVAIATSRDSAVMRVITAVTVVFLPGTFTATLFSTTFFNFGDGIDGRVYSRWLWLYFVVTVALTAIVMGGTWVLWKSKEKEITKQLDESSVTKKALYPKRA